MKVRFGFVSNSSSSSFVILKAHLTILQIAQIIWHNTSGKQLDMGSWNDPWSITELTDRIEGYTSMDNFDMAEFLGLIGVDDKFIEWGE